VPRRRPELSLDDLERPNGGGEGPSATPTPALQSWAATLPPPHSDEEEPVVPLYCRIPQSISVGLRDLAHERSRGKRKRVHLETLVAEALRRYLEQEREAA